MNRVKIIETENQHPGAISIDWDAKNKVMVARTEGFPDPLQAILALEFSIKHAKEEEMKRIGIDIATLKVIEASIFYREEDK